MSRPFLRKALKTLFRTTLIVVVVLGVIPFLLDIGPVQRFVQNRLHHRFEAALSHALGRSVKGGNIDFTTLSGFGFNMENVSVGEAEGFGPEHFLYAENVHFVLGWHSFVSGHFELSRIVLTGASINLVRNPEGHWNFETWFSNYRQTPDAPTGESGVAARAPAESFGGLPFNVYFDGDRINFKDLAGSSEKKVFFLSEISGKMGPAWFSNGIDFDLRLKLSRTDVPMENSGLLRVSGSLGPFRSASLWPTVVQGQMRLEKFPYSDMVALLSGRTTYLHGLFDGRASFLGQLNQNIRVNGQLDLVDLHSWVAVPRDKFTSASLAFSKADVDIGRSISLSDGRLRVGSSEITLKATLDHFADPQLDLTAKGPQVHLNDILEFLRGFSNRIPADTRLEHDVRVDYHLEGPWHQVQASAHLAFTGGQIQSRQLTRPAAFSPFSAGYESGALFWDPIRFVSKSGGTFSINGALTEIFGRRKLAFQATGRDAELQEIEGIGRSLGLWPTPAGVSGAADFSLQWAPARKPPHAATLTGSLNARSLSVKFSDNNVVWIAAAKLEARDGISRLSFTKANWGRSVASGNLQFPQLDFHHAQVNLNASFLDVDELLNLGFDAHARLSAPFPSSSVTFNAPTPALGPTLDWTGKISSIWLYFNKLQVTKFHSDFAMEDRIFRLDNFSVDAYSGKSRGRFILDWQNDQPRMHAQGHAENVKLDALLNLLTPLGPAGVGRVTGDYSMSAEKGRNQPWEKTLTAHVVATIKNLENSGLKIPAGVRDISTRLKLHPTPDAKQSPFTLNLDLDYGEDEIKINDARLSRSDVVGSFSGVCSKKLDLDLSGTVESTSGKRGLTLAPVLVGIQGPINEAQIVLTSPQRTH